MLLNVIAGSAEETEGEAVLLLRLARVSPVGCCNPRFVADLEAAGAGTGADAADAAGTGTGADAAGAGTSADVSGTCGTGSETDAAAGSDRAAGSTVGAEAVGDLFSTFSPIALLVRGTNRTMLFNQSSFCSSVSSSIELEGRQRKKTKENDTLNLPLKFLQDS